MDLKDFLDKLVNEEEQATGGFGIINSFRKRLGLFFWERGGKQFYLNSDIDWAGNKTGKFKNFLELKNDAEYEVNHGYDDERNNYYARDFLDCLDCLGEDKVKELIKGVN